MDAVTRKVLAQPRDIAREKQPRIGIDERVDRLRQVNDFDFAAPVQHIERGEIRMNRLMCDKDFHVPHQPRKNLARLVLFQPNAVQCGRRKIFRTQVLHQNRVVALREWTRHIRARRVQRAQVAILVRQPRRVQKLMPELGFLLHRQLFAASAHLLAFGIHKLASAAVLRVVFQRAKNSRAIHFCGDIFHSRGFVRAAAVHRRLFAALYLTQHIGDEMLFVKGTEVVDDPRAFMA